MAKESLGNKKSTITYCERVEYKTLSGKNSDALRNINDGDEYGNCVLQQNSEVVVLELPLYFSRGMTA